jgi:hypothetical protein
MVLPSFKNVGNNDLNNSAGNSTLRGLPPGENFIINGAINGFVSNIIYYSYAIGYSEIQSLMNMGPSTQMDTQNMTIPPYLIDTWWTQQR